MAKNAVRLAGNGIALTLALASALFISSCKKDTPIKPENSPVTATSLIRSIDTANKPSEDYKISQPISLNGAHDITISGESISGGSLSCIDLVNCYNIHITRCKLTNSDKFAVNLSHCTNIIVDSCYVDNVATGIYAFNSRGIQVKNNKMKNLSGSQQGVMVAFENLSTDIKDASSNSAIDNEQLQ